MATEEKKTKNAQRILKFELNAIFPSYTPGRDSAALSRVIPPDVRSHVVVVVVEILFSKPMTCPQA
jgi:hypothetical protein